MALLIQRKKPARFKKGKTRREEEKKFGIPRGERFSPMKAGEIASSPCEKNKSRPIFEKKEG